MPAANRSKTAHASIQVMAFETALGWMAIAGRGGRLRRLTFAHPDKQAALQAAQGNEPAAREEAWHPELAQRLQAYAEGATDDFHDVVLDDFFESGFQRAVVQQCRRIRPGTTITYGELAAQSGWPSAARAVGTVMARNPVPLVVPCHRVVPAAGGLGNYSAGEGPGLKRRLLDMEADAVRQAAVPAETEHASPRRSA